MIYDLIITILYIGYLHHQVKAFTIIGKNFYL